MAKQFRVELQRDGLLRWQSVQEARKAAVCGVWHDGQPWLPNDDGTVASLPYAYRKAFSRGPAMWWVKDDAAWYAYRDLYSAKGKYMGTLIATLLHD
jgi:hypothetical protein